MNTMERVRNLISKEFEIDPASLQPDTELESLGVDSLSLIEFMISLEDEFRVQMPEHRVVIKTLRDVADELDALMAAQHATTDSTTAAA